MSKPCIIVCGKPKLGKSTEVFKSFQNSLAILSSENNPHYYKKLLNGKLKGVILPDGTTPKYKPPRKIKLIDVSVTGVSEEYSWLKPRDTKPVRAKLMQDALGNQFLQPDSTGDRFMPVPQIVELEKTISSVVLQSQTAIDKGEKPKYDNVIIDEWGEFMDRAHSEIIPTSFSEKGKLDTRAAFLTTGEWVAKIVNQLKQLIPCGVGVCLVMHDREPDGSGKVFKAGGPKGPSANMSRKLVAMTDGAIQRVMIDPEDGAKDADGKLLKPMRIWKATASEAWDIGLRGLEPEDEDRIGSMELEEILTLAGFDMSNDE